MLHNRHNFFLPEWNTDDTEPRTLTSRTLLPVIGTTFMQDERSAMLDSLCQDTRHAIDAHGSQFFELDHPTARRKTYRNRPTPVQNLFLCVLAPKRTHTTYPACTNRLGNRRLTYRQVNQRSLNEKCEQHASKETTTRVSNSSILQIRKKCRSRLHILLWKQ